MAPATKKWTAVLTPKEAEDFMVLWVILESARHAKVENSSTHDGNYEIVITPDNLNAQELIAESFKSGLLFAYKWHEKFKSAAV